MKGCAPLLQPLEMNSKLVWIDSGLWNSAEASRNPRVESGITVPLCQAPLFQSCWTGPVCTGG